VPAWIIEIVFLAVLTTINLVAARLFGEAEFWFAMVKIIAIIMMIVIGIYMVVTHFKTPTGTCNV
jgi:AAT family amino acid transporter